MNKLATIIVQSYLEQDFMPRVEQAIQLAITQKNIINRMPKIVTENAVISIFDPLQHTNQPLSHLTRKHPLKEAAATPRKQDKFMVPRQKHHSVLPRPSRHQLPSEKSQNGSLKSTSFINTNTTDLLKLPEQVEEEQNDQIKNLRKLKALTKDYEQRQAELISANKKLNKYSGYNKLKSLNLCPKHHTYDYYSEIVRVSPRGLDNFKEPQGKLSLLQNIKRNLDNEIDNTRQIKKMEEFSRMVAKKEAKQIPAGHIESISDSKGQKAKRRKSSSTVEVEESVVNRSIRPHYDFLSSHIQSLSKNIQNNLLSQGIKMITHEEHLVQQNFKEIGQNFKIKEELIVKQKSLKKKQKTHTSQSIIYSLGNQLRNPSILQDITSPIIESRLEDHEHYQSEQLNHVLADERYLALTSLLGGHSHSKQADFDRESLVHEKQLPIINRAHRLQGLKKRTSTEHKSIKGLESIEVKIATPQHKASVHFSHRNGHMSALGISKQTESSLQQNEEDQASSRRSNQKSKKECVRDYFKNYKEQFRHKLKGIEESINLYS